LDSGDAVMAHLAKTYRPEIVVFLVRRFPFLAHHIVSFDAMRFWDFHIYKHESAAHKKCNTVSLLECLADIFRTI
jgi:hypothetical protein